jgi:hypothetical protein
MIVCRMQDGDRPTDRAWRGGLHSLREVAQHRVVAWVGVRRDLRLNVDARGHRSKPNRARCLRAGCRA